MRRSILLCSVQFSFSHACCFFFFLLARLSWVNKHKNFASSMERSTNSQSTNSQYLFESHTECGISSIYWNSSCHSGPAFFAILNQSSMQAVDRFMNFIRSVRNEMTFFVRISTMWSLSLSLSLSPPMVLFLLIFKEHRLVGFFSTAVWIIRVPVEANT